jgi:hypothetical protein
MYEHHGKTLKRSLKLLYINVFPMDYHDPKETECLWVLSTGRCGTLTMSQLLDLSPNAVCLHEPMPRFVEQYAGAFGPYIQRGRLSELVRFGRIDITSTIKGLGYWYAEAGHHMTSLAPYIKEVYPKSKFVYLRRDMDGYVQSGYQWNLYDPELDHYLKDRPRPPAHLMTRSEKVAWLWCYINEHICHFLKTIPEDDWYFLDFDKIKNHDLKDFWSQLSRWGVETPDDDKIEPVLFAELNRGTRLKIDKNWHDFNERADKIGRFVC